jgi:hypothetical protein
MALADSGVRAEVREAALRRRREGAHGRSQDRGGSLVATAAASIATSVSPSASSNLMKSATPNTRTEATLRS